MIIFFNSVGELVMLRKTCRRFNNIINVVIRDELEFNKYIWNFKFKFTYKSNNGITYEITKGLRGHININNLLNQNFVEIEIDEEKFYNIKVLKGRYLSNVSNLNLNALPSVKPKFTWRYLPGCFGVWTSKIGSIHQLRTNLKVSKPNYSFEGQLGNIRNIRFFLANQSSYLKKKRRSELDQFS
ncbi:hypothetical protein GLOIN_2v1843688 [Rhizophagus irregularis DAOM 181602=DAOM 197198]|uniref:F-box domain-containing protein n=1 Tax=Rhizophagus irregularis (strain DAOM 181602 / DAOM 197198 / MUCL 43194) TaxID=747089 RepID=A0A2P4PPE5_RHIID|nr:hypothetical protein GLOIN_2v1843688 [Rhizophagus irregularis DAOM 181602=DAOM 197198]POG67253.1 hypothetical protein GLOIN_2v1843688 [Rhizophagus irregularis DAOM 181602=DAOM 197198]|eukprot:XP_025174119.1 hypothetical protein GLOIN_2v1843688 [Rhizophagus irregularis DAOM 181602=DAOM 197198]